MRRSQRLDRADNARPSLKDRAMKLIHAYQRMRPDKRPARHLVDSAVPPITRGLFRARKIWIDDALGGAARCRRVALRQRRVAALVIVAPSGVHMQAHRISRIVRLSPTTRPPQNRPHLQNPPSRKP